MGYLEEECQHGNAMILIEGTLKVLVIQTAHNHMQLSGIGLVIYQILATNSVVLAPMKVKLLELVVGLAFQRATPDARHLARLKVHGDQHGVSIVGQLNAFGLSIEIEIFRIGKLFLRHVQHIDVNGALKLAAAALIIVTPMLRSMLPAIAKVLSRDNGNCNNG